MELSVLSALVLQHVCFAAAAAAAAWVCLCLSLAAMSEPKGDEPRLQQGGNSIAKNGSKIRTKNSFKMRLSFPLTVLSKGISLVLQLQSRFNWPKNLPENPLELS